MKEIKIGWIGTGVMGSSMCSHLLNSGFKCIVHNRTKEKANILIEKGAEFEEDISKLAKNCDIIFTILGYPKDVEEIYLKENGLLNNVNKGSILVDMTTSSPELARKIYKIGQERGVKILDAPVSGGDLGAKNATLTIFASGDEKGYEKVKPLLEKMGKEINYFKEAGSGQNAKAANQIAIASNILGTVEILFYAKKANLDPNLLLKAVLAGSANSWQLSNMGPRILNDDFNPGFYIKHFVKDMGIILEECKKMKITLPGLELTKKLYDMAIEEGLENLGTHGLYKILEKINR